MGIRLINFATVMGGAITQDILSLVILVRGKLEVSPRSKQLCLLESLTIVLP